MGKVFLTSCVECSQGDAPAFLDMVDETSKITHDEFKAALAADEYEQLNEDLGYAPCHDLSLASDWHVSFSKSTFKGQPVVYCDHSGIECIFSDSPSF